MILISEVKIGFKCYILIFSIILKARGCISYKMTNRYYNKPPIYVPSPSTKSKKCLEIPRCFEKNRSDSKESIDSPYFRVDSRKTT